ncbi:MAG: hypothetical protein QW448_08080, partial [Thermofilaceae archaeon]
VDYEEAGGDGRMRFTELLDRLAHPTGLLIRRAFEREGFGDPDRLAVEAPRKLLDYLSKLFEDERTAKLFLYLTGVALRNRVGVVSEEEWLHAFESNDATYVRGWMEKLDELLR